MLIIPQFNHYRQIDRRSQTHKTHFCYYLLVFDIGIAQKQTHHRPHRPHRRVRHWIATTTPFVFSFEIEREREKKTKTIYNVSTYQLLLLLSYRHHRYHH